MKRQIFATNIYNYSMELQQLVLEGWRITEDIHGLPMMTIGGGFTCTIEKEEETKKPVGRPPKESVNG
jgi:hypothetical protein